MLCVFFTDVCVSLTVTLGTLWGWPGCSCTCVHLHQCGQVHWLWWAGLMWGYQRSSEETRRPTAGLTCCCCHGCPKTQSTQAERGHSCSQTWTSCLLLIHHPLTLKIARTNEAHNGDFFPLWRALLWENQIRLDEFLMWALFGSPPPFF